MKVFLLFFLLFMHTTVFSQTGTQSIRKDSVWSVIVPKKEAGEIFSANTLKNIGSVYPIRRVYKCHDTSGLFYILLTEEISMYGGDTLHKNIKAIKISDTKNGLVKNWEINDHTGKQVNDHGGDENSIWFWTKYCTFTDLDNDLLIDPVFVYGSSALNGLDDGRIKILVYHKNQKYAIRHQNGILDPDRNTQVDAGFYVLPNNIVKDIKQRMENMMKNNHAIFPYGWEKNMERKKTYFDER